MAEQLDFNRISTDGEETGDAGTTDVAETERAAHEKALAEALQEGLDSGEATDFDIDEWLEERRGEDDEAA